MNRRTLGGLIVLNVAMLLTLALLAVSPQPAQAQAAPRPGDYIMVAGKALRFSQSIVYINDLNNGVMIAVSYDPVNKRLGTVGYRTTSSDFAAGGAAGGAPGPRPR